MLDLLELVVSLGIILLAAELFTNGVEWLGKKLKLGEGAVGSILAAVGTAMPETMIPVIAILFGHGAEAAEEIGIGAILGAPFMLGTLAIFITGLTAVLSRPKGLPRTRMYLDVRIIQRDWTFFLIVYTIAILVAFAPTHHFKVGAACVLISAYLIYAYLTVKSGKTLEEEELHPLYFARKSHDPGTPVVVLQILVALGMIVGGARVFVLSVEHLARVMGVAPFVLSLIIAPVATELPEKFNSILWVKRGKDTLAMGNITGAMVFQSSMVPSLGILLTPWELNPLAITSAVLAIVSAGIVFTYTRIKKGLRPGVLLYGGFFYSLFVCAVIAERGGNWSVLWASLPVLAAVALADIIYTRRAAYQVARAGEPVSPGETVLE